MPLDATPLDAMPLDAMPLDAMPLDAMSEAILSAIQPLSTDVVHLIAAGEVIDSLTAVVRELVENSLDAGATRITIALWPDLWRVRVTDNGLGLTQADLQQSVKPHSTSKIRDRHDLWKIHTLGFRGEALYSLAQLGSLEICSRPRSSEATHGLRVVYGSNGMAVVLEPVAIAPGTLVTLSDLFGALPHRRQGLPSLPQQMRHIQGLIQRFALCHPPITWIVEQNDRPWFSLWPGESAQTILPQVLKTVAPSDLRALTVPIPDPSPVASLSPTLPPPTPEDFLSPPEGTLHLVIGLPDRCHRRRPDWVSVAINGRMVHIPELEQTLVGAFRRTLPRDRFPVCFVHLRVGVDQVDWNRHPAKTEVYLHHLPFWQTQIERAIAQLLQLEPESITRGQSAERTRQLLKTAESSSAYQVFPNPSPTELSPDPSPSPQSALSLLPLRVIGQVLNTYIVVEHPGGLWLVEQHIAHERILYEQLGDRWQLVPLEPPVILQHLSLRQQTQLERIGLTLDPFGENLWAIRTAPQPLAARPDCAAALTELSWGDDLQTAQVAVACRSAIRNGTPLTLTTLQTLIEQWQQTRNPRTCPHGRPIYLSLEESSLARFFRRHWVIGKSHGI